jgi:hypothetical protein
MFVAASFRLSPLTRWLIPMMTIRSKLLPLSALALSLAAACGDSSTGTSTGTPPVDTSILAGETVLSASAADVVYDAKRNVLYASEPDFSRISVLDLAKLQYRAPISVPGRPADIDLTPGGDSLVVALRNTNYLGFINLKASTPTTDTVRLLAPSPRHLRVMANGKVLVSMTFAGSGYGGSIEEYDLKLKRVKGRTDVGFGGAVTEQVPFAASADRKKLLALIDDSCCPESGYVYDATTDTWSGEVRTINRFFPDVSASSAGSSFLIGSELFTGSLIRIGDMAPNGYGSGPTAIAPDGASGFFATGSAVATVSFPSGSVVASTALTEAPTRIYVLPSGSAVVVFSASRVRVIKR